MRPRSRLALLALSLALAAAAAPAAAAPDLPALNRAALELGLPLQWPADLDGDGAPSPEEVEAVWGLGAPRAAWVQGGAFTPAFREAWARVEARAARPPAPEGPDAARQRALARELDQSRFVVIATDLRRAPAGDRAFVGHLLEAATLIERLHARQRGTLELAARIPEADGLSRLVHWVNQGPWCSAPSTEADPDCTAVAPRPPRLSGLYPADLQQGPWCAEVQARGGDLASPFTALVRAPGGGLAAVPYPAAWPQEMAAVAEHLRAAAAALGSEEARQAAYLRAAARAFQDGRWFEADRAWARVGAESSRWYVRAAPDEVYFEPCSLKAGFHLTLARVDRAGLDWRRRLAPARGDMERALAALAGRPYRARAVDFQLPDFLEVVLNAGDDRAPRGGTAGQSLPNFGPVAAEGRGRTVAMTNLQESPESRAVLRARAEAIFCPAAMARYAQDKEATLLGTVLHEAAHNLGPAHAYRVGGRTAEQRFGGPLASTLEELKAETSALWLADWLAARGLIDPALRDRGQTWSIAWTFGHVARGMRDPQGKLKPYSALAAIQLGALIDAGALAWDPAAPSADGRQVGCLAVDPARLPAAVDGLERRVLRLLARGDVADAQALVAAYVDAAGPFAAVKQAITERYNRWPAETYLYAVRF